MKDLPLGAEIEIDSSIFSIMKIANFMNEPLYKIQGGVNGEDIYVTGDHFIYDTETKKWIKVKYFRDAELQYDVKSKWFSCLITTNRRIQIGERTFWDWEDDELY